MDKHTFLSRNIWTAFHLKTNKKNPKHLFEVAWDFWWIKTNKQTTHLDMFSNNSRQTNHQSVRAWWSSVRISSPPRQKEQAEQDFACPLARQVPQPSFSIMREPLSRKEARGDIPVARIYLGDTDADTRAVYRVYPLWYALLTEPTALTQHRTGLLYGGSSELGLQISDIVIARVYKDHQIQRRHNRNGIFTAEEGYVFKPRYRTTTHDRLIVYIHRRVMFSLLNYRRLRACHRQSGLSLESKISCQSHLANHKLHIEVR